MRVAMVVYAPYSRDARVRRYAESLAQKKHRVEIICLHENYQPADKNIRLIMFPLGRRRINLPWYFLEYAFFFLYALTILSWRSLFHRYSFVHVHNMPDFLVFTALIPKLIGSRIILDMHDPMPELFMTKYRLERKNWLVLMVLFMEKWCFAFADKIITANGEFKKIFLSRNSAPSEKIEVINNFPDQKLFKYQKRSGRLSGFRLMYMGTIDERFNLEIALEAMPRLIKKISGLQFIIIPKIENEGNYYRHLLNRINELGINKYVVIKKPLSLEAISKEIIKADIGLTLLKKNLFTEKIMPLKLTEFLACGIPVVATKTGLLEKTFSDKMICFLEKNTSEEFYRKVLDLYRDKNLRKSLSRHAVLFFKKFNWPAEEKKYDQIIKSLVPPT